MRVIVLGAGGVGGVIGGRLHQYGHDVMLIARGAHREAIHNHGLRLEDPDHSVVLNVPVVGSPSDLTIHSDDVVILATKTQDAFTALSDLRLAVGDVDVPVICATNGVEAERVALRSFNTVIGMNIMMPTAFLEPGVVQVISAPIAGSLDLGLVPTGTNRVTDVLAEILCGSQFVSASRPDIMRAKYRKLIMNCANAVEAACGKKGDAAQELIRLVTTEAEEVLAIAGIDVSTKAEEHEKLALMVYRPVNGKHRGGGSTWQSIATGRSIETDFLNGEIVLIGRENATPTPVNALMQLTMHQLVRSGQGVGSVDAAALLKLLN